MHFLSQFWILPLTSTAGIQWASLSVFRNCLLLVKFSISPRTFKHFSLLRQLSPGPTATVFYTPAILDELSYGPCLFKTIMNSVEKSLKLLIESNYLSLEYECL